MARIGWKNRLVTFLVRVLGPKPRCVREVRRILVVSTTALGDSLWATPSVEQIRKGFPDAQISLLTSAIGREVFLHHPGVDSIYVLKEPLLVYFLRLLLLLRRGCFDVALLLHASQRLTLPLLVLSGIPRVIGSAGKNKGLDALLTEAVPSYFEHEIERRARIIRALGISTDSERLSYFVQPHEVLLQKKLLGEKKKTRIALHLGARERYRRFPQKQYILLGKSLQNEFSCELFLSGTSAESDLLFEVQEQLPFARVVIKPFREFAAVMSLMDLILSTDTGPLHLACALNRPLIALFASSDPKLFGPHRAPYARVIQRRPCCDPCLKRRCQEPFCFLQIPLAEIMNEARDLLYTRFTSKEFKSTESK